MILLYSFWNWSDFQLSIAVVLFHEIEDMIPMIQVLISFEIVCDNWY